MSQPSIHQLRIPLCLLALGIFVSATTFFVNFSDPFLNPNIYNLITKPLPALLQCLALFTTYFFLHKRESDLHMPDAKKFLLGLLLCSVSFIQYTLGDILLEVAKEETFINWIGVTSFMTGHWVHVLGAYYMGVGANGSFTALVDKSKVRNVIGWTLVCLAFAASVALAVEVSYVSGTWIYLIVGTTYFSGEIVMIRCAFCVYKPLHVAFISAFGTIVYKLSDMILIQNGYGIPIKNAYFYVMIFYWIAITVTSLSVVIGAFSLVSHSTNKKEN